MHEIFSRGAPRIVFHLAIALFVLTLAACGGSDGGTADGESFEPANGTAAGSGDTDGADAGEPGGGDATATLVVAGEAYTWTAEQMNVCEIDGVFGPANGDFGVPPSQGAEGPWFQFIDRGDGGINFSAVLDGEEYTGTGSGEADEIGSNGFSYTGSMGTSGESVEVELEVSC